MRPEPKEPNCDQPELRYEDEVFGKWMRKRITILHLQPEVDTKIEKKSLPVPLGKAGTGIQF